MTILPPVDITTLLGAANDDHSNIKLNCPISSNVSFLDLQIENREGQITISDHHKDSDEHYVLPFKSDHPRHTLPMLYQQRYFKQFGTHQLYANSIVNEDI
ncbi:unnamed protein product [Rotaria magnacalcarata]|uniref:Uncharacterized protein n=1 Tax=Rotaria magnacalcarata TaxID=392030 RepID=A0A819NF73_9BILA|nr:unnamed protein product [Rotaria magnacalcarata]